MGVTVVPYNSWRENLAVNVLGGLLNNFLEQNRQAEQNRKVNAFRGQLQQDLANNIAQQQESAALSLAQPDAPAGYNANPWASTAHESYSPLTPFDIGTSVIPMRDPTVQEINSTADTLGASRRFSMVNPEAIQGIKTGMVQQAEAQRIRNLQESYAEQLRNAPDLASQISVLGQAAINGGVPYQAITPFSNMAVANTDAEAKIAAERIKGDTSRYVADSDRMGKMYTADRSAGASMYSSDVAAAVQRENYADNKNNIRSQGILKEIEILGAEIEELNRQYDPKMKPEAASILQQQIAQKIARRDELLQLMQNGGNSPQVIPMSGVDDFTFSGARDNLGQYGDIINKYAEKYGIDPDLIYAIAQVESGNQNGLTSKKGAQGIMQLIPSTARYVGVTDPFDPNQNIRGGVKYFREMLDTFNGDVNLALRAYNAGPGAVKAGRNPNPNYARNVLAIYNQRKKARKTGSKSQSQLQTQAAQNNGGAEAGLSGEGKRTTQVLPPEMIQAIGNNMGVNNAKQQGLPLFINSEGQTISTAQFYDMLQKVRKKSGEPYTEDELYQAFIDRGYKRDIRERDMDTTGTPAGMSGAIPENGDYRPSFMRGDFRTAPMVIPQTTGQNYSVYNGLFTPTLNPYTQRNKWSANLLPSGGYF